MLLRFSELQFRDFDSSTAGAITIALGDIIQRKTENGAVEILAMAQMPGIAKGGAGIWLNTHAAVVTDKIERRKKLIQLELHLDIALLDGEARLGQVRTIVYRARKTNRSIDDRLICFERIGRDELEVGPLPEIVCDQML